VGIYLDHNATTPVRREVADAMAAALRGLPGNPSSTHAPGRAARAAVEDARADVARLIGAHPEDIVFTSGGTEANDLTVRGLLRSGATVGSDTLAPRSGERARERGRHVVTSRLEHPSVIAALAAENADITFVAVDGDGRITPDALRAALRPDTALVTLALANHEIGNVYDIAALARVAHDAGALFHTDAVQAAGKLEIDVGALGVDALTLSAHKLHGPKGVGAAYIRRGAPFVPVATGGHQERERRAGTENVSGIVGFGVAARLAAAARASSAAHVARLLDRLQARLRGCARTVRRRRAGPRRDQRLDGRSMHVRIAGTVRGAAGAGPAGGRGQLRAPLRHRA
jgi:cysteine desulfurase